MAHPAAGPPSLPLLERLRPVLAAHPHPVYLVGGAVRDLFLNRDVHDLDFAVAADAIRLTYRVADSLGVPAFVLDRERDTGRVVLPGAQTTIDFARFRAADLDGDLRARDFTVNAMALPAADARLENVVDPCAGRADLDRRLLRQTNSRAIADDPVRALRAVRFAVQLALAIDEATAAAVAAAAGSLRQTSNERLRDEIVKIASSGRPDLGLQMLHRYGLLAELLPDIAALEEVAQSAPHHEPVLAHTISVLRWLVAVEGTLEGPGDGEALAAVGGVVSPYEARLKKHLARPVEGGLDGRALLCLAALFHDAGKLETQTVEEGGRIRFFGHDQVGARLAGRWLRDFRFSNEATAAVKTIVAAHMRPLSLSLAETVTRRAIYRFFRATGPAGLDVGLLSLADHLATHGGPGPEPGWTNLRAVVRRLFDAYYQEQETVVRPPALLSGRELIAALNLKPGPEVGRLLRQIEEAQAAGEITTREEALALARSARR